MSSSPTAEPTPATLRRFRNGDVTALGAVFDLYGDRVHRLAEKLMGNRADAEDATQEIFLRAFEQAHSFRGDSSMFTWLYRLAVRHCLNCVKQRRRRELHERAFSTQPLIARRFTSRAPLDHIAEREQTASAQQLLSILPASHRICLVLREVEGFNYAQIAEFLDVPVGTVMSRLARGRQALLRRLPRSDSLLKLQGNNGSGSVVQPSTGAKTA